MVSFASNKLKLFELSFFSGKQDETMAGMLAMAAVAFIELEKKFLLDKTI
jgi:hypothetical protein